MAISLILNEQKLKVVITSKIKAELNRKKNG
jgi:hypothetical protein